MKPKTPFFANLELLSIVALTLLAARVVSADQTSADNACLSTLTQQNNACSASQTAADNGYLATLQAQLLSDLTDYNTTKQNDYLTAINAQAQCDATLWGFVGNPAIQGDVGSCQRTQLTQDANALATYKNALANCANNTNPTSCICPYTAAYNFATSQDAATAAKCQCDAQNQHDNTCYPNAADVQVQADANAAANQGLADSTAQAVYSQKTTLEDNFTTPLCYSQASTTYNNCVNDADCLYNTNNCCLDHAANAYNNALLSAYSAWINTVGPADAQYQHDYPLCSAQQSHDDAVATALCTFNEDTATDVATTADVAASDAYDFTEAIDLATFNQTAANCVCNNPNNTTKQNDCIAAAQKVQNNNDAAAGGHPVM